MISVVPLTINLFFFLRKIPVLSNNCYRYNAEWTE